MIKGLTVTQQLSDGIHAAEVADLLATLGFAPAGDPYRTGAHGFLIPMATLELTTSNTQVVLQDKSVLASQPGTLRVEVAGLDDVRVVAEGWMCEKAIAGGVSAIRETEQTRFFTAEPVLGTTVTFWEWTDPLRGKPVAVAGDLSAEGMRFAIVVARWNAVITDRLLQGALDGLYRSGAKQTNVKIVRVPGAWEIPSAARKLAESGRMDAIVTLGLLLRGETAHYEAIYNEVSRGLGQSQQETGIPHAFGVLTCETLEQALDRAGLKSGNKGFEAACAAIEMVSLHRKLAESSGEL